MPTRDRIFKALKHTLLESGPNCVQLIYSLKDTMWGLFLFSGTRFQATSLDMLNFGLWPVSLIILGLIGLWGLLFDRLPVSFTFAGCSVFLYGFIGAECFQQHAYLISISFFFEMLVMCWMTFRIPYDARPRK